MIEQLEHRTLLSADPHVALNTLRADLSRVGRQFSTMVVANNAAILNLQKDMSIFSTHLTSDNAALRLLSVSFRTSISTIANDFNNLKLLIGQDIARLITETNAYNRHPTASAGTAIQATEQLLTSQGIAAATTLTEDASVMQIGYQQVLQLIANSHPLSSTLSSRASHISTAFSASTTAIHNAAETVAVTDIPSFITALEPNGVIATPAA